MTFNWMTTAPCTLGLSNSRNSFWSDLWDYAGVIASHRGDQVLANPKGYARRKVVSAG